LLYDTGNMLSPFWRDSDICINERQYTAVGLRNQPISKLPDGAAGYREHTGAMTPRNVCRVVAGTVVCHQQFKVQAIRDV